MKGFNAEQRVEIYKARLLIFINNLLNKCGIHIRPDAGYFLSSLKTTIQQYTLLKGFPLFAFDRDFISTIAVMPSA